MLAFHRGALIDCYLLTFQRWKTELRDVSKGNESKCCAYGDLRPCALHLKREANFTHSY